MSSRVSSFCVALVIAFSMAGCSSTNDAAPVVVYTSVDRIFSEPVLKAAEAKLGFNVIGVYDTEETKSTGIVNRLIAKKDNPDGDIFWSGDPARAAILKSKGITAAYDSPAARDIPEQFNDSERQWIGFSARTRVLLVNTDLVRAGDEPGSIFDLTDPKWAGRVGIANPLFGTTSFHIAALFETIGDEETLAWLDGLKANGVKILTSNGEVKRQVASGQVSVGLSDSDDASEAIADGQPIRAVLLDQDMSSGDALGSLVMPNTVSLIRGGPNPERAKQVIDFLLSGEAMTMLAESCAQAPLRPGVAAPANVITLDGIVPMKVDYADAAQRLESIMPMLKEWATPK
jgi:iron(III) transport system substrate-binding protein